MKRRNLKSLLVISVMSLSTMMCVANLTPKEGNSPEMQQQVQETVNAMTLATMVQSTLQQSSAPVQPTRELPASTASSMTGSIQGRLSYPSEMVPPLRIVAFRVINGQQTGDYEFINTIVGQNQYQMDGLPVGSYWVVAYTINEQGQASGLAGGYTKAVPCGLSVECSDRSLIPVEVQAGQTSSADPADWYAPPGSFPADPLS